MPETERPAAACPDVKRALEEGEQRSREAANPSGGAASGAAELLAARARTAPRPGDRCRPGAASPPASAVGVPPSAQPWRVALWRRHKWKLFGLLLFLLTEFCLFTWGGTPR